MTLPLSRVSSRALLLVRPAGVLAALALGGACAPEGLAEADGNAPRTLAQQASARSAAPFGCAGEKVALHTPSGFYVGAFFGGGFGMVALARSAGEPETFRSISMGESRVALQASSGHYVIAQNGGGGSVHANAQTLAAATAFILSPHPDGRSITLRTPSGYYLNATLGGGNVMNTNTRAAGDWEALRVRCLEGALDDAAASGDASSADDGASAGDSSQPAPSPSAPGLGG